MGRPQRLDQPKKVNLSLSAECRGQLGELADRLSEGERTRRSLSEIVESAVTEYHARKFGKPKLTQAKPK